MYGGIRDSLFRPELLKRIAIYGLLTLLLGSAQCSFFPMLNICPSTPDLIMGMILAVMLIDSQKSAAVLAVCAGFFIDAVGGTMTLSPIIYLIFVLFIGAFSHKMLTSFASFCILMIPALVYRAVATAVCMLIADGASLTIGSVWGVILPELLCSAILCLPLYAIVKLCATPLETHSKFTF